MRVLERRRRRSPKEAKRCGRDSDPLIRLPYSVGASYSFPNGTLCEDVIDHKRM